MSGRRREGAPSRSGLAVPDLALWEEVRRGIVPLRRIGRQADAHREPPVAEPAPGSPPPGPPRRVSAPPAPRPHIGDAPPPPAFTGLDRRLQRRLVRGRAEIEARLDLHGERVETARFKLRMFLEQAQAVGLGLVLVITGKGSSPFARHTLHGFEPFDTPERQGRLRRLVPQWLGEAEFRLLVAGYQPAHPKHGGGGAFYLRLRRANRPGRPA